MKKFFALLAATAMLLTLASCGNSAGGADTDATTTAQSQALYSDSLEILNTVWDNIADDAKFSCMGGNVGENAVEGAPGNFDVSDTDGLTYTLLVPETVQANIDNAASLVHLMNANTFTGAAVHMTNGDAAGAAEQIKTAVLTNPFMCGFPEQLVVMTTGDYVVYAFGSEDNVTNFKTVATARLTDVQVICDQPLE